MYIENYQIPKPLRDNLAFLLRVAAERATSILDAEAGELGIHSRQLLILALAEHQELNQNAIAEATQTHPNAVISMIDSLEAKGFAKRKQNPANRREYLVQVTGKGRKLMQQLRKATLSATKKFAHHLDAEEEAALKRILLKLLEAWSG